VGDHVPGADEILQARIQEGWRPTRSSLKEGERILGRAACVAMHRSTLEKGAIGTAVEGSAGYVAIERVSGTLHGRSGIFVLQHSGTMTRGSPLRTITVVPDSGTGELVGLAGRMTIIIAGGKHSYDFEYTFAEPERSAGE
jgi:hypothetical protein